MKDNSQDDVNKLFKAHCDVFKFPLTKLIFLVFCCLKHKYLQWCCFTTAGAHRRPAEPHFHLDLDRSEPLSSSSSRPSPFLPEASGHSATPEKRASSLPGFSEPLEDDLAGIRQRARGERVSDDLNSSPRPGLQKYLSRFDDAMKLRGQLANEKPVQDGGSDSEEFDPFRIFRLIGSVLLAVFVRLFVCKYLVSLLAHFSFYKFDTLSNLWAYDGLFTMFSDQHWDK